MALTPEDVVNKRFNPTKFREGYDQDEVDDFLDEVVVELRRLNQENEELRQRLMATDSRINELQAGGAVAVAAAAPVAAPAPVPEPAFAPQAAAGSTRPTPPTPTTCSSSRAASTRSTSARAWRSATRSSPRVTPRPRASSPRPSRPAHPARPARAGARRTRAPDRRAAHLRARVPPEAQGLHRGPAARPRDLERADHERRRRSSPPP